jgi:DNA helicase-2/ATP-dependent DNA helicase PcrA
MMTEMTKVFGPPGSGKTTYLLSVVEKELAAGVSSARIGYFSFTRKAAHEARDRAIEKFPTLDAKMDFPFFRTLHSLAFFCLGMSPKDMMGAANYAEFAKEAGISLKIGTDSEEHLNVKADNPILNEINIARIKGLDLHTHYNQSEMDIEWFHFEFVERAYRHYKQANSLFDFTDLLEMIVQREEDLPYLDVVIVDEAQDLSRIQWDLVQKLAKRCKRFYLAGDDDQAVYTWAGADVKAFLAFPGRIKFLTQSHRVPSRIHTLASSIVSRIQNRQEKTWFPKAEEGGIKHYNGFHQVDITAGEWLIMASTNYMLNDLHNWIKSQGLLFERQGRSSIPDKVVEAVVCWERLRAGQEIPLEQVKTVYSFMAPECITRGHRTLPKADPDKLYSIATLTEHHGLQTDSIWHQVLTKIGADKIEYLIAILRRGAKLTKPTIFLSTIHGAKGGEADNVLLLTDLSPRFATEYAKDADNINRLLYVGITRAKKTLHLVLPKDHTKAFRL